MKIVMISLILFFTFAVSGQTGQQPPITPEKKALIDEIRQLTGLAGLRTEQKTDKSNIGRALTDWVDKQTGLTDAQMRELKRMAEEGGTRIEADVRKFVEDKTMMTALLESVSTDLYDRNFTESELREMAAFYRTPTGKKEAEFSMKVLNETTRIMVKLFGQKFKEFANGKLEEEINKLKLKRDEMKSEKTKET